MIDPYSVVERVIELLDEGNFVSTYKHAVLLGLIDLCAQKSEAGVPPTMVTTRELALAVVEIYWPHTRPWSWSPLPERAGPSKLLSQNASVLGAEADSNSIVGLVYRFRREVSTDGPQGVALQQARARLPQCFEKLLRRVERILVEMPLPKLQRIGGVEVTWLYSLGFDDRDEGELSKRFTRYVRGAASDFDNAVRLVDGVGEAFVRLGPLLRAFVQAKWSAKVARLNKLDEARLPRFLFGAERENLLALRAPLLELQEDRCFYCGARIGAEKAHVDHFLPWSRLPLNALGNLVVADPDCNGDKRDFLASAQHLERWLSRNDLPEFENAGRALTWETEVPRVLDSARALYLGLPQGARIWSSKGRFELFDRMDFARLLSSASESNTQQVANASPPSTARTPFK